eukprot:15262010-Heterocapsa_arctica.AAC.1
MSLIPMKHEGPLRAQVAAGQGKKEGGLKTAKILMARKAIKLTGSSTGKGPRGDGFDRKQSPGSKGCRLTEGFNPLHRCQNR